ncbi:c-type cytochrome [Mesonia sp. K7]|uniref:c-type cytochrome n=1 Tax=Mesonia sp. K7 TaxID=2218606 RepID=UPI000DA96463|nr:c-type cytochrome [Mesonia sp. K7]PZD78776.1 cytochrome C [Mesonia sp. K7]
MKKENLRNSISKTLLALVVFFTFSQVLLSQETPVEVGAAETADAVADAENAATAEGQSGDAAKGKELFNSLCASCHKPYSRSTGPALHGVTERRDRDWIYEWVKNSAAMIASGDAEAVAIYEEYNQTAMNAFPQLSDADIDDILAYVEQPKPEPAVAQTPPVGGETSSGGVPTEVILAILAFVLALLVIALFLVNKTLNRFASESGIQVVEGPTRKPIWKAFVENQFLVLVTSIFLLLAGGYFAYGYLMQVGVDQGYEPVQPIHFSHRIHAGDNAIECKYCHSSARVSKTSGIPSLNVCMNCHKSISEVADASNANTSVNEDYTKEFYDGEIAKLYDAVGWDKTTQSYTGETKPVKWVRIHNLPDFAYFNHSQHVSVAGIACQECHGPVEEMEIMRQHSPLTMGWCINCHRETNVKVEGNEYYEKIHAELSKKYGVETLTAAQMGALECGKCHY